MASNGVRKSGHLRGRSVLYSFLHSSIIWRAWCRFSNQFSSRHEARSFPLNDSMKAFWIGLPGWMKLSSTLFLNDYRSIALLTNSVQLSQTIFFGSPRVSFKRSSSRATHVPPIEVSTKSRTASCVKRSFTVNTRKRRPDANESITKAIAQISFGFVGAMNINLLSSLFRRLVRLPTCSPSSL